MKQRVSIRSKMGGCSLMKSGHASCVVSFQSNIWCFRQKSVPVELLLKFVAFNVVAEFLVSPKS